MEYYNYKGAKNLVYAEVIKDEVGEEGYKTGEVKPLAGLREIGKVTETETEVEHYDDVPAFVTDTTGSDEITLTVSALDLETLADITGQYYDPDTAMFVEGERKPKYFAIGYIAGKTNGEEVYVWRLKGMFGVPESTHKTRDGGTDSDGQELKYTGINTTHIFKKSGKTEKGINIDLAKDKCDVTGFFDTVQTPDTVKAKQPAETPTA